MNINTVKKYLTTREVSELLGLSVGTVQKMVDKKILDSYITTGGHRRILVSSVQAYMSSLDQKQTLLLRKKTNHIKFDFNVDDKEIFFLVNDLPKVINTEDDNFSKFTFITKPSELLQLFGRKGVLVVDASLKWIDWYDSICEHGRKNEMPPMNLFIFNSQLISTDDALNLPDAAVLFKGDVNVDFVRGLFALESISMGLGKYITIN